MRDDEGQDNSRRLALEQRDPFRPAAGKRDLEAAKDFVKSLVSEEQYDKILAKTTASKLRTKNGKDLESHDSANPTKTLVADLHNDTYSHRSLEVRQHSLRFHTNLGVERSNNFLGAQENEPVAWSKAKESSFHVCNNAPRLWHPMRGAAHFGHLHKAQEGLHGLVPTNAIVGTALLRMNSASLPNTLTM